MEGPEPVILTTKLHVPQPRASSITRARLTRLFANDAATVTVVAAPAGFGKTTAVVEWLASDDHREKAVAWLSLDARDNDAATFWRYVVAAIELASPGAVSLTPRGDGHGPPPAPEAVVDLLINRLQSGPPITLVLDDLHLIDDATVHDGLSYLVEHLPSQVHLVVATRADPPLPLARLRVNGRLGEIRAGDLRFTETEAARYLTDIMGLEVSAGQIAALDERTEGWIAALQLAALSLRGHDDPARFIARFAGDDRYVVDYLVEEVLQQQQESVRRFLLHTSILGRLTGGLCDAVTGGSGSSVILDELDRGNLFVVPLDDQRLWYRYHHLFAEMLRARLAAEEPELSRELHLRASGWYERNGLIEQAIEHAFGADAFVRAADLLEASSNLLRQNRQELALLAWLEMLPPEVIDARPSLGLIFAGTLLSAGRIDRVEELLSDVEAADPTASDEARALHAGIALYRGAQSMVVGDGAAALSASQRAVQLAAEGNDIEQGASAGLLGLALWAHGNLDAAAASWTVALEHLEAAGYLSDVIGGSLAMADILLARGHLTAAEAVYRHGLELATRSQPPLRGAADMHVGLSGVHYERNDLAAARAELRSAESLGEHSGLPQNRHRRRLARARLLLAEAAANEAIEMLDEAERLYVSDMFPDVRPIAAVRARAHLSAGRPREAREWARRRSLTPADALSYAREYEHATLARVLLADPTTVGDAEALATRLVDAARDASDRGGSLIELLVLLALARSAAGHEDASLDALEEAVTLAGAEGYVRVFVDEGARMSHLLTALAKRATGNPDALRLLGRRRRRRRRRRRESNRRASRRRR
ncbi:helix-turn-helix transcriptional regulator [Agromyces protaetiae]|uniref:Helix-turn-helix transcriptional regulator n=1 Tax=Agromyces protaetiae TaxID=2509455 RepID=A0A4P6FF54_9MICO|nr:AAA family ATPase [Agromyces protaetiae]QAY73683.1 helix-turn-helix transcriptional regulator [Agromyces protaetiae]